MNFLRTLGWIALTVVVVVFSLRNWTPVTINLFGNLQADVKLPVLLLIVFLLGFLPTYAYYRAIRWKLKRKLIALEPLAPLSVPTAIEAPAPGVVATSDPF